jgi:trk system potassium uptake protein TrkH
VDSFFEAMSGFTTTGASVLVSIETQPEALLLWRNFTQWLGGMGIITLFVALFPMMGLGAAHLFEGEMPGPQPERLRARVRDTARALWLIYSVFSLAQFVLMRLGAGLSTFESLNITFGTMPTGGFLPKDLSVGAYADNIFVTTTVTVFMVLAGVNFALYYHLLRRRPARRVVSNTEFRIYLSILLAAMVFICWDLVAHVGQPVHEAVRHASFQAASILTTTGFTVADFGAWPPFSRAVLLLLMIVGASAGSTGGALKVVRVWVLLKHAYRRIVLAFRPREVIPMRLGETVLSESAVSAIVGTSVLYAVTLGVGFAVMSALGLDLLTAFSSVAATVGNVGPGLGLVGPSASYAAVPTVGKVTLALCMLVGRLEFLTVLALLTPAFWRWR